MAIPSRQIGWSTQSNLLWQISKRLELLIKVMGANNTPTTTTTTTTISNNTLKLTFDNITNVPVADASSVSDWNTFFDLPNLGGAFTSVQIVGNEIQLIGGSNITLKDELFDQPDEAGIHLIEIRDDALCVIAGGYDCFGADNNSGCPNLTTAIFPAMVTAGDICFSTSNGSLINVDFSSLTTAGDGCFQYAQFIDPDFPVLSPILNGSLFSDCVNLTDSFSLLARVTEAGSYCFRGCTGFINLNLPLLTTAGRDSFAVCTSLTSVNLPLLTAAGENLFYMCTSLTTINLPSCTDLGGTVGDNNVFDNISGNTITLTVPSALITCNSGDPDGDIDILQTYNTVTVITV